MFFDSYSTGNKRPTFLHIAKRLRLIAFRDREGGDVQPDACTLGCEQYDTKAVRFWTWQRRWVALCELQTGVCFITTSILSPRLQMSLYLLEAALIQPRSHGIGRIPTTSRLCWQCGKRLAKNASWKLWDSRMLLHLYYIPLPLATWKQNASHLKLCDVIVDVLEIHIVCWTNIPLRFSYTPDFPHDAEKIRTSHACLFRLLAFRAINSPHILIWTDRTALNCHWIGAIIELVESLMLPWSYMGLHEIHH